MLKRIHKVFPIKEDAINYFYENHHGRNKVEGYEIKPTKIENYSLYILKNEYW